MASIDEATLIDLAIDASIDFTDMCVIMALFLKEEERISFHKTFDLESYTQEQCEKSFRFHKDHIINMCQLMRIPARLTSANGTVAPGIIIHVL